MSKFLTATEAKAFNDTDVEGLVPEGSYRVRVLLIEPKEGDPSIKAFKFKVLDEPAKGRTLRAWPSTAPDKIWTMKKLIGAVVVDPVELELEDLEGHIFMAEVKVETRRDNGELTNRVVRLLPLDDAAVEAAEDDDLPY